MQYLIIKKTHFQPLLQKQSALFEPQASSKTVILDYLCRPSEHTVPYSDMVSGGFLFFLFFESTIAMDKAFSHSSSYLLHKGHSMNMFNDLVLKIPHSSRAEQCRPPLLALRSMAISKSEIRNPTPGSRLFSSPHQTEMQEAVALQKY